MMMTDNQHGAVLMMAAMAAFTVSDSFMKLLAPELPFFQTLLWRGIAVSLILFLLAHRAGAFKVPLARRDRLLVGLRSLADTVAAYFFLQALYNMPIANLAAIAQSLPLSVTLAAALVFREPVGWRRLLAIALGFIGVVLIVRPDAQGFDPYAGFALIAMGFVTVRELLTRLMAGGVPTLRVAFWNGIGVMLLGLIGASGQAFVMPAPAALFYLAGTSSVLVIALVLSVMAIRHGEMGFVSSFRYTAVVWALILGWVVFGEWPDVITVFGAALIVGTGLFTLNRERLSAARWRAPARH